MLSTDKLRFVSPGVMVGYVFIVEGIRVTPRPVLWNGIDLGVEGLSLVRGIVSQHRTALVGIAGNLNDMR